MPAQLHLLRGIRSPISRSVLPSLYRNMATATGTTATASNDRPQPDELLSKIAHYVHRSSAARDSSLAMETGKYCLLDTLGCGLAALQYKQARDIIAPVVPQLGSIDSGTHVPGTNYAMDPVNGAFAIGTLIRWLDFNDCWLAAEWGHPSDNLGGILAVADHLNRSGAAATRITVSQVIEAMVQAHEIQGVIALENSFNAVGLDHVVLVKLATTAVVARLLGLSEEQTVAALSQSLVDGQALRTYRHAPNTGSRKSWAAGDACSRAVKMCYLVRNADVGTIPSVLTAPTWGFYDALFRGKPFTFTQRSDFGAYVMENVLFKISYPAEFHAQTAVEAAMQAHAKLKQMGKTHRDISRVTIRTQDAAMRIIDKHGPLHNYADRDHCIQYMAAIPLIHGRLTADDYHDAVAQDPAVDALRAKMVCVRDEQFSRDYLDPAKRAIPNALTIELNDGTVLDEIVVEYPVGHRRRRDEGIPKLMAKFERHLRAHYGQGDQAQRILDASTSEQLGDMPIHEYIDLYTKQS